MRIIIPTSWRCQWLNETLCRGHTAHTAHDILYESGPAGFSYKRQDSKYFSPCGAYHAEAAPDDPKWIGQSGVPTARHVRASLLGMISGSLLYKVKNTNFWYCHQDCWGFFLISSLLSCECFLQLQGHLEYGAPPGSFSASSLSADTWAVWK